MLVLLASGAVGKKTVRSAERILYPEKEKTVNAMGCPERFPLSHPQCQLLRSAPGRFFRTVLTGQRAQIDSIFFENSLYE